MYVGDEKGRRWSRRYVAAAGLENSRVQVFFAEVPVQRGERVVVLMVVGEVEMYRWGSTERQ